MKNILLLISIIILLNCILEQNYCYSQSKIKITGIVLDDDNKPVPFVNVFLANSAEGSMTDKDGKFSFNSKKTGKATIIASTLGYQKFSEEIDLNKKNMEITIHIKRDDIKLNETVITASSFSSEKRKGLVLNSYDVLTTPGGAADIFQSLKTMPGITQVSESAELYIRGGDPIETLTMLDQSILYHPYTFESSYGGIFSNINTANIKGMFFSSGGFSAKYGNALSGVLDIETKDEPDTLKYNIGLSLANASVDAEFPLISKDVGLRFSGRKSFTNAIFWLNGKANQIISAPTSGDISGSLIFRYSETGRLKISGLLTDDKEGVQVERAQYIGTFDGTSTNKFLNLHNSDIIFSNIILKSSISYNNYGNLWKLGVLDFKRTDIVFNFRNDLEGQLSSNIKLVSGFDIENRTYKFEGIIPKNDYDIRPGALNQSIDAEFKMLRYGIYSEFEISKLLNIKNLFYIAGIRFDNIPDFNNKWFDPRITIGYKINAPSSIKMGWGIYHQVPDPRLFNPIDGNPNLQPMKAVHYIVSYENNFTEKFSFRAELYHKKYSNLPLKNEILNYDNSGNGFADGVDIIVKGTFPFGLDGWVSYGYINTKRKWMDFEELSNSTYDITHNLSIVAKYNISAMWQVGLNYKYATGMPYTPVLNAIYHTDEKIFEPVYGIKNSARNPNYQRLDLRFTHFDMIFDKYFTVFYLECINILDIKNIFGYSYSPDYTQKNDIISYFGRRTIVFGANISL